LSRKPTGKTVRDFTSHDGPKATGPIDPLKKKGAAKERLAHVSKGESSARDDVDVKLSQWTSMSTSSSDARQW